MKNFNRIAVGIVALSIFAFTLGLSKTATADETSGPVTMASSDVTFTCEITGSDKAGFEIYVKNPGPESRTCKATCTLTKKSGGTAAFTEEKTIPKTERASLGGRSSLSDGPFESAEITSSGCVNSSQ